MSEDCGFVGFTSTEIADLETVPTFKHSYQVFTTINYGVTGYKYSTTQQVFE